jgi:phospholipid/cholesterol/gamma-HCH transport system substrate-binding protein
MNQEKLEFRVGLMVLCAVAAIVVMVFRFGEIGQAWKSGTHINIVLPTAVGVVPETAVRMRGLRIGQVESVRLLPDGRGVIVAALIEPEYTLRSDAVAQVQRSLLGDGVIEIIPGQSGKTVGNGDHISGTSTTDPMAAVARVEQQVSSALASFDRTGQEWGRLANNLNRLLESEGPGGINTLEQSALALAQFTETMKSAEQTLDAAGGLLQDPRYQQQLQRSMTALPELLNETQRTLQTVNSVARQLNTTVSNLNTATTPLAAQSETLVTRLNRSLGNIETMTQELAVVSQLMNRNDGTMKKLMTDPSMYQNLNSTTTSLAVLLRNLEPVVRDLQIFSDKIARHPELLGVRGVVKGSSGIKESGVQPASFRE